MSVPSRIVRRLRLRGPTEAAIQRAIPLVEDAIRTASLPGDGGRIVLVRRMAIGRIDPRTTSQSVSVDVGRAWERIASACAHGSGGDLTGAPAVWFRDALEAHTSLALRLLGSETTDAWYWPLAVPAWRPHLSVPEAVRRNMLSLAALPEAPAALPQWTSSLAGAGHAERLVAALRAEDVAPLARAAGLRIPAARDDLSVVDGRDATAGEPDSAARTRAAGDADHDAARDLPGGPRPWQHGAGSAMRDPRRELLLALLRAAGSSALDATLRLRPAGGPGGAAGESVARRSEAGMVTAAPDTSQRLPRESPEHAAGRADESHAGTAADVRSGAAPAGAATELSGAASPLVTDADRGLIATSMRDSVAGAGRASLRDSAGESAGRPFHDEGEFDAAHPIAGTGAESRAGGLLFLVPVLDRLGYAACVDAQPHWSHVDVARRLFARVLARLAIDEADPAWQLTHRTNVPAPYDAAADRADPAAARRVRAAREPRRFVAPASWRTELCERGADLRIVERSDLTTLWDPSGRLLLGAWRGQCPRELLRARRRAVSQGHASEDSRRPPPDPGRPDAAGIERTKLEPDVLDLTRLVTDAWLVAARRWLRRHAGIGIASLVQRPAQLALTPTHVDLTFELAAVEIRIRRVGLDLDPGWVPWLGRVVTFLYRDADGSGPT